MSEWVKRSLGELIDIKHGFAFRGEFFRDEPPGEILLTPGNFAIGGGFKAGKYKYYDGPVPEEFVLNEGDLIVTMTDLSRNADTLGYSAVVPSSGNGRRFLHNQRLGRVTIKREDAIDPRYLHYLMRSPDYRNEIVASATGTTVKHTSPDRIKRFRFAVPTLLEQGAIAHILGTLDATIDLNRRTNETVEAIARALFGAWFVEFKTVRANADGRDPGMPKRIADLFPSSLVESEYGEIPEGWEVKSLDQVAHFLNGLALQKYPAVADRPSLPVIKIAQLRAGNTHGADRASADLLPDYIVEDGDLLFSWSGSLECVLWAGGRGALNQHLFKVTAIKYPKWLCYFGIHLHLAEFRHIAAGKATTMGHIQRHHLSDAKLPVPPLELLSAMDTYIGPMVESVWRREVQSRTLRSLRDMLLPKLISGELRIRNAEKLISRTAQ